LSRYSLSWCESHLKCRCKNKWLTNDWWFNSWINVPVTVLGSSLHFRVFTKKKCMHMLNCYPNCGFESHSDLFTGIIFAKNKKGKFFKRICYANFITLRFYVCRKQKIRPYMFDQHYVMSFYLKFWVPSLVDTTRKITHPLQHSSRQHL